MHEERPGPRALCNSGIRISNLTTSRGLTNFGFGEDACQPCIDRAGIRAEIAEAEAESAARLTDADPFTLIQEAAITHDPFAPDADDLDGTEDEDPWAGDADEPEFDPYAGPGPVAAEIAEIKEEIRAGREAGIYPPADTLGEPEIDADGADALVETFEPDPIMPWSPPDVDTNLAERLTVAEAADRAPLAVWYYDGSKEFLLNVVDLIPKAMGLCVLNMGDGMGFRARPADMILAVVEPKQDPVHGLGSTGSSRSSSDSPDNLVSEQPPSKEKAVTTNTVRKGTNRPAAEARTRKAAQRTALPARGDDKHAEMQAVIEEAVAEVAAPKKSSTRARKTAAAEAGVKRARKAAKPVDQKNMEAKIATAERGERDTAVNTEGRSRTSVKAQRFMTSLAELDAGWEPITLSAFDGDRATVVAKRGDTERVEITWDAGVYVPTSAKYISAGGRERILRNASDVLKNWAPKSTSALKPKRTAPKAKAATKGA